MRKAKKIKIKYVYVEPKTPEEKAQQHRKLDKAFDMIFDSVLNEKNNKEKIG